MVTEGLNQLLGNQQLKFSMKRTFMCFPLILLLFYEIAFDLTANLEISPYTHALREKTSERNAILFLLELNDSDSSALRV